MLPTTTLTYTVPVWQQTTQTSWASFCLASTTQAARDARWACKQVNITCYAPLPLMHALSAAGGSLPPHSSSLLQQTYDICHCNTIQHIACCNTCAAIIDSVSPSIACLVLKAFARYLCGTCLQWALLLAKASRTRQAMLRLRQANQVHI